MDRNNLDEGNIRKIESLLKNSLETLTIPVEPLKQNPTIAPILQKDLYQTGIEN
jgi:hypothetical protein